MRSECVPACTSASTFCKTERKRFRSQPRVSRSEINSPMYRQIGRYRQIWSTTNADDVVAKCWSIRGGERIWKTLCTHDCNLRLKFGERSCSCAGPTAWNSLPPSLHELTHTETFKSQLKTFLFQQAYQQKKHMSAVLRPTLFHVVLFRIGFTIFNPCKPLVNVAVSGLEYEYDLRTSNNIS